MPKISTRVGEVSYSVKGTGQPIFLIHATLHSGHDYDGIIPQLSLHYQTIAIDLPWHGNSLHPPNIQPIASLFADVLEDIVINLALPPGVLIGNSVGGFAAARLAVNHPDRVRGLILVNTGGFVPWHWLPKLFTRLLGVQWINRWAMPSLVWRYMVPQNNEDKKIAAEVSQTAGTVEGSRICASIWQSFLAPEYDLRSKASELNVPTLIVWGKKDPIIPIAAGKATHEIIKGSRFEVLDTGHVVFASKPEAFLEVVEPFLEECFNARS